MRAPGIAAAHRTRAHMLRTGQPPASPLAATLIGGNRNDNVNPLLPQLQAVPSVRGKRGRPRRRRRPDGVLGDRGHDHDKYRRLVWDLGVKPVIARRGTEHGSGLGPHRRVVERANLSA
ncbi:hypothetical protein GCM10010302_42600 [Streptomyces polychromogenes]|uniref:Transposase n=1 Tax=Streptomyces polychromogenes TaxID=67342 RepID=A0ABN0VGK3_9ACTN